VNSAVEKIERLEVGLSGAHRRVGELERLLKSFEAGDADPAEMQTRLDRLERENRDMRARLDEGRSAVERLLAKIRFLEDQR
jgi:predicted nuclease with TOPRIM domain